MPSVTLPTELWIVIIDFIIEAVVNPAYICNYQNFSEINNYFNFLQLGSAVVPSYQELRLVCRAFNELLKTPSRLFMKRSKTQIPKGTRALFISHAANSFSCLRRILQDPSRSRRIVTLCIPCAVPMDSKGLSLFEILVQNSYLLSGVRSLAFDVVLEDENSLNGAFWDTLNEAFPALVYLALRPNFKYGVVVLWGKAKEEKPKVTFEKLEVLKMGDHVYLYHGLNSPLLRHVALGCSDQRAIETLARSPRLESVLLRTMHSEGKIDLSSLPKLKLFGIPVHSKNTPVPLPRDYAGHLCAYVTLDCRVPALVQWVKRVASYFHNVPQIALDLTMVGPSHRHYHETAVRRSLPELRSNGLVIDHLPFFASYIVIKRIAVEPKVSSALTVTSTVQSETLWDRWNRFCHAAYYRLHI